MCECGRPLLAKQLAKLGRETREYRYDHEIQTNNNHQSLQSLQDRWGRGCFMVSQAAAKKKEFARVNENDVSNSDQRRQGNDQS